MKLKNHKREFNRSLLVYFLIYKEFMTEKEKYEEVVKSYFNQKAKRFLIKYPSFTNLKKANNTALNEWSKIQYETKHHGIYHKYANLTTAFKSIKRSLTR